MSALPLSTALVKTSTPLLSEAKPSAAVIAILPVGELVSLYNSETVGGIIYQNVRDYIDAKEVSGWVNAAHLDKTKKTTTGGVLTTIVNGATDDASPWPYIAVGGGVLLLLGVTALIVSGRKSGRAARSFGEFDDVF